MKVNSARTYHCAPDWFWSPKSMPYFNLWCVLGGRGEMTCEGYRGRLSRGTCMFFRPGASCDATHDPERPLKVIAVHFDAPAATRLPAIHTEARDPLLIEKLLERTVAAWNSDSPERAAVWLEAALTELDGHTAPQDGQTEAIDALCDMIAGNPGRAWNVPDMARRLNVCVDHFSRLFRKRKGMAPHEFALEARLDYAKCLLSSSSHPVERVAELCGYNSLSFMTRQFKAKTGLTPSAFRRLAGGR